MIIFLHANKAQYHLTQPKRKKYLLAGFCILHAEVITEEKFSIKQLDGDDSENEVEQEVDNQDIANILQRIYNTVEHGLKTNTF